MVARFSTFSVLRSHVLSARHLNLRASRSRRGASVVVETALCMTLVVLPISIGILQYGIVMSTANQLEQISREGARYAAVHGTEATFAGSESTVGSLRYYLKNLVVAQRTSISWTDLAGVPRLPYGGTTPTPNSTTAAGFIQIIYANGMPNPVPPSSSAFYTNSAVLGTPVAGQGVSVRVVYPMTRKVFVGNIAGNSIGLLDNDYISTSTFLVE